MDRKKAMLYPPQTLVTRWGLTELTLLKQGTHAVLWRAVRGGGPVVLKIGAPEEIFREAAALELYNGTCAAVLLEKDVTEGALLTEELLAGVTLAPYFPEKDIESVRITAHLLQQLHRPPPSNASFPHIADWLSPLFSEKPPSPLIPASQWARAQEVAAALMHSRGADVLLHGDLHHDNIVQHGKSWWAIDPKGVVGEAGWDVTAFMRNPIPSISTAPALPALMRHRLAAFSAGMDISVTRLTSMSFVGTLLSAMWAAEDTPASAEMRTWCNLATVIEAVM